MTTRAEFIDFENLNGHTVIARPAPSVVVDAGGNLGGFTQAARRAWPNAKIVTIEPQPREAARLRELAASEVAECALSDREGETRLFISDTSEASSIVAQSGSLRSIETVRCATLPTVMQAFGLARIDVLKLDIEGSEIPVLNSLPDDLLRAIPQITIEYHEFLYPQHVSQIHAIDMRMKRLGFGRIQFSTPHCTDVLYFSRKAFRCSRAALTRFAVRKPLVRMKRGLGLI